MRAPIPADAYRGFHDLAARYVEGTDYAVHVSAPTPSRVAIIAPHGGRIEGGTSSVARLIAGAEHGLYLFEGLRTSGDNFDRLHLTSRCFDEPRCLALIGECDSVVAVHGYAAAGPDVLLGGLDESLKATLLSGLAARGVSAQADGHRFPGRDVRNVCNRGRSGRGVQLELSARLRRSRDYDGLVDAVRAALGSIVSCGALVGRGGSRVAARSCPEEVS